MNCSFHENVEANYRCVDCGKAICKECAVNNNDKIICKECAEKLINTSIDSRKEQQISASKISYGKGNIKTYSDFWAFMFSLMPGAGHMYLGLMKRGLQLMCTFFAVIIIPNLFYSLDFLAVSIGIAIWFYSFFDAHHIKKRFKHGEEVVDELVYDIDMKKINYNYVGIGIIGVGGLRLVYEVFNIFERLTGFDGIEFYITRHLERSIFPALLIIVGIIILRRSKKKDVSEVES